MPRLDVHICQCISCQQETIHPDQELHRQMNLLLSRLDEQHRRWYVAVESNRIGVGEITCSRALQAWTKKPSSAGGKNWPILWQRGQPSEYVFLVQVARKQKKKKGIVTAQVVFQCGRDIPGRLVQALVALLRAACLAVRGVLLDFGPQAFRGSSHLARHRAGQLSRQMKPRPQISIRPILQRDFVAHLAMGKGIARDKVQGIAVGQLRGSQHGVEG